MRLYFAPLEGITGRIFRCAHHQVFNHVDRYYAPFIFTNDHGKISKHNQIELLPDNNPGFELMPQLLSNCAEDFIKTALSLKEMGYQAINLNLGCPSQTVFFKGRGSGFLRDPEGLERFLDQIFMKLDMDISLKTRVGAYELEEWERLLEVYKKFPAMELIIHPRLRKEFYGGSVHHEVFAKATNEYGGRLCYNGDIFTVSDAKKMADMYPGTEDFMIGRGLLTNPALCRQIKGGKALQAEELILFFERLCHDYESQCGKNVRIVPFLKELWRYIQFMFETDDRQEIYQLLRVPNDDRQTFMVMAEQILRKCQINPNYGLGKTKGEMNQS